jgi:hypothetical protein
MTMGDPVKGSVLSAAVAAIGLAALVSACGHAASPTSQPPSAPATSAPASASAPASPSTVPEGSALPPGGTPAGYQRIGGPVQGLTVAVPSSWVTVNLGVQTLREAIRKVGLAGADLATLAQTLQALQKLHAVYAIDDSSVAGSPGSFATNVNAYCINSGLTDSGSASVPLVRRLAVTELQRLGAQNITQQDVEIGGVPGVQTSYTLSTSAAGTLHAAQLEVLPKPERGCFITLTAAGPLPSAVLSVLAPSVQYT